MSTNFDAGPGGTGNQWFGSAGGVAYVNSWRWNSDTPVWVFHNMLGGGAKSMAEAGSHEIGHALGLLHDGTTNGAEYYSGHGSGETGWAPIMGVGYNRQLTQWSSGEYNNANQTQDDIAIIASSQNTIGFRADDHGDTTPVATDANPNNETSFNLAGIISTRNDQDSFRVTTGAGE